MAADGAKRVGVIGAGMVGVCVASYLQRDGHSVFLVDPGTPGEGASFGNAGAFNASSVTPMATPGIIKKVPGWLRDPLGPLVAALELSAVDPAVSLAFRARRDRGEGARPGARACGRWSARPCRRCSRWSRMPAPSISSISAAISMSTARPNRWRRTGSPGRCGARTASSSTSSTPTSCASSNRPCRATMSAALLVRENGHTSNPFGLVSALVEHFVRQGGVVIRAKALGFRLDGGRLTAIRTDAGELAADAAVVAAGAWSKPLAASLGDKVPLETERGYHLMIRDPEVMPSIPTADADGKFVATPMDTGLRLAGTVELAGLAAPPDWRRARLLLDRAARCCPASPREHPEERISVWMGHRPSMPNSLPVIGLSRATPDVVYAFGHGHVGMTAAPMTGRLVADLVAGRKPAIDISPFAAARF